MGFLSFIAKGQHFNRLHFKSVLLTLFFPSLRIMLQWCYKDLVISYLIYALSLCLLLELFIGFIYGTYSFKPLSAAITSFNHFQPSIPVLTRLINVFQIVFFLHLFISKSHLKPLKVPCTPNKTCPHPVKARLNPLLIMMLLFIGALRSKMSRCVLILCQCVTWSRNMSVFIKLFYNHLYTTLN